MLEDLANLVDEIRTNMEMLYELLCDAKSDGHTYDELGEATGLARGTLQDIFAGRWGAPTIGLLRNPITAINSAHLPDPATA